MSAMTRGEFALRVLLFLLLVGLALLAVWLADLVLLLFASILLAVILSSASSALSARIGLGRGWCLAAVVLLLLGVVGGVGFLFGRRLVGQADDLAAAIPGGVAHLRALLANYGWGQRVIDEAQHMNYASAGSNVLGRMVHVVTSALDVVTDAVLIFFAGLYLAGQPDLYLRGVLSLTPPAYRSRMTVILGEVYDGLRHWVLGQLVTMAVVGTIFGVALAIIGVPSPVVLGLIAALSEFIPLLGPVVATVPAVLAALSQSYTMVIWVVLAFLVIQQIESNLLVPFVQRRAVHLPPVLALFATVLFGLVFGIAGLLFANPLVVAIMIVVRMAYVTDALGGAEPEDDPDLRALVAQPNSEAAAQDA